jgi:hypothetical protein
MAVSAQHERRPRRLLFTALLTGLGSLAGCASMDDFSIKRMNFDVFRKPPDPIEVVVKSTDGAARARAIGCLNENSGPDVMKVLRHCAAEDMMPACRLAAIDRLRHFKDPAAAEALKEAYYRAGAFPSSETASILRRQALAALADTRQPGAVELLVRVLREPPAEGADVDRQAKLDERLTAARALGNFNSPQATAALAEVLAKEEDVGLQRCVHGSLVSITGKDLPADGKTWNEYLANPANRDAIATRQPGGGIMELVGFRK